jgi:hypothetical protein
MMEKKFNIHSLINKLDSRLDRDTKKRIINKLDASLDVPRSTKDQDDVKKIVAHINKNCSCGGISVAHFNSILQSPYCGEIALPDSPFINFQNNINNINN